MSLPAAFAGAEVAIALDALPESVAVVRQAVTGAGEGAGLPVGQIEDMALAVSEAATNVVVHAYRDGPGGPLEAGLWLDAGSVSIVVRDYGGGIAPRTDSPGLGVGLPLISTLADRVELLTAADGANEVHMRFPGADGASQAT